MWESYGYLLNLSSAKKTSCEKDGSRSDICLQSQMNCSMNVATVSVQKEPSNSEVNRGKGLRFAIQHADVHSPIFLNIKHKNRYFVTGSGLKMLKKMLILPGCLLNLCRNHIILPRSRRPMLWQVGSNHSTCTPALWKSWGGGGNIAYKYLL